MLNSFYQKKKKGFTLIEMLVAISLFSLVLIIVLGAMLTIVNVNRRAQALASVINNFNASVESMNRVIKSAEPGTIVVAGDDKSITLTVDNTNGLVGPSAYFGGDVSVTFAYDDTGAKGVITRQIDTGSPLPITSADVDIQNLQFLGGDGSATNQPEVLIIISGEAGTKEDAKTSFEIMTTVSQRQRNDAS